MDSYGYMTYYESTPLEAWIVNHWKRMQTNRQSLQAVNSATCGHYALKYLVDKSKGKTLLDFVNKFSPHDYVSNDHRIAQWMKTKMLAKLIKAV